MLSQVALDPIQQYAVVHNLLTRRQFSWRKVRTRSGLLRRFPSGGGLGGFPNGLSGDFLGHLRGFLCSFLPHWRSNLDTVCGRELRAWVALAQALPAADFAQAEKALGDNPRPVQVSPVGKRYFGATVPSLRPFRELLDTLATRADLASTVSPTILAICRRCAGVRTFP